MDELTEREVKLLEYIKRLISALTIEGITENRIYEIIKWRHDSLDSIGMDISWQDDMLKFLEIEYGLKYNKLDDKGNPLDGT
jgi:hypothetical protein